MLGFFVSSVTGVRAPYKVSEIQKDPKDQQGSSQHHFGEQGQGDAHQKFLKASEELKKRKSVIMASQIMNKKPLLLEEGLSPDEVWELIKDREIHDFPIVSSEGKLVGLINRHELIAELEKGGDKTLKEMASEHVLCAEPETHVQDVIKVFFNAKVHAVPIVGPDDQVLGVLSRNDLLKTMMKVIGLSPGH